MSRPLTPFSLSLVFIRSMRLIALSLVITAAQPGLTAPVFDLRSVTMAARLFPTVQAIRPDLLAGEARRMLSTRRARITVCRQDAHCVLQASIWTEGERELLARSADIAVGGNSTSRWHSDDGTVAQVRREIEGVNSVIQVYGLGFQTRNPELDGPLYRPGTALFATRLADAIALGQADEPGLSFIDPSLSLSISLLNANDRTDAIAFEPLDLTYNSGAARRAQQIDWAKYRYSTIIVPGNGPDLLDEHISPRSKLRVMLAAQRFAERVAPFILVSGGAVHPRGTKFTEALEMRQELIEQYGVPQECIILEPYARYTSTNLRNAARWLQTLHAPLEKQSLIITDEEHSRYLESPQLKVRMRHDLGYEVGIIGPRVSATEIAFTPSTATSRIDPIDPLDP